jgi:hypothetical protein
MPGWARIQYEGNGSNHLAHCTTMVDKPEQDHRKEDQEITGEAPV